MTAGCPQRLVAVSCVPEDGVTITSKAEKSRACAPWRGAGARGVDVVHGRVEARGAEAVGPVEGLLAGEQAVTAGAGEVVERSGGFGFQHGSERAEVELRQLARA